ncbi:hypothetical protein M9H77_27835 [Catharanthus roseus]|uniref:Uncharacterized protein n=1 Tax=Catharanthus roseus TaxID=4058 RepID=A0ACC0AGB4_CATRO|nr:hypothetical protein M9H77_27835 [Catharanthus roseus]
MKTIVVLGSSYLVFLSLISSIIFSAAGSHSPPAVKGAYWPSSANSVFPPSSIDSTLFTHIFYAFLSPNEKTYKFDIDNSTASVLLNFTSTLHSKKPPLKTLYSIGGGAADSSLYARMASNEYSRMTFISSTIEVARKFGFDGIDLDWEFPKDAKEMDYFSYLIDDWRVEVEREAKVTGRAPLLLTAAVYFSNSFILESPIRSYHVASINKNLDMVNAMCYDFAGAWNTSVTGAHAALFDPNGHVSTSYGLNSWLKAGLWKSKLVMGLPLYGKTWTLKDPSVNGVGAPAVNVGPSGPGGNGTLFYYEIKDYILKHKAKVTFDVKTVSVYGVDGKIWIGYDDRRSVALKLGYAQILGIRGYFFWALSFDQNSEISKTASALWKR